MISPHTVSPAANGWARFSATETVLMRVSGWRRWWLELRGKASVERIPMTGSVFLKGSGCLISIGAGGEMTIRPAPEVSVWDAQIEAADPQ